MHAVSAAAPHAVASHRAPRFIDLFCGIGGFRIAFERAGARCLFSSDWDKYSQKTYAANFGDAPHGDINALPVEQIPAHDILCGGFPCQPFSIAGVSKKNSLGRKHGFDDARQGNLFFAIRDILRHHRPAAFVLENVKNLKSHDKGRTFRVIYDTLAHELGYQVHYKIIDAQGVVPQHRERIFLIGFREPRYFEFPEFPAQGEGPRLGSILEKDVPAKYTLTPKLWDYLQGYAKKHQAAGNGFGFGLVTAQSTTRTLSARYYKDGSEILISQGAGKTPRRLTPRMRSAHGLPGRLQDHCLGHAGLPPVRKLRRRPGRRAPGTRRHRVAARPARPSPRPRAGRAAGPNTQPTPQQTNLAAPAVADHESVSGLC
jgi:DNA (cytosine-5)-methyltransferase 1